MTRRLEPVLALIAIVLLAAGLASAAHARPNPQDFVHRVDNPWFPLAPGTTWIYRGSEDGEPLRDVVTATRSTELIDGVRCVVVRDRLYKRGKLAERTTDWYAQDRKGNVWYFGEDTAEIENGRVKSTEGTWRAGVRGAQAGIFMPAHPRVGRSFRQEYFKGHAEDHFRIVSLAAHVKVPYTTSSRALLTKEWTPLEPGVIDHKLYVRGVGDVKEQTVKGGSELLVLVDLRHA